MTLITIGICTCDSLWVFAYQFHSCVIEQNTFINNDQCLTYIFLISNYVHNMMIVVFLWAPRFFLSKSLFTHSFCNRCNCGHCVLLSLERHNFCCCTIPFIAEAIKQHKREISCIVKHEGFEALCLNHYAMQSALIFLQHIQQIKFVNKEK